MKDLGLRSMKFYQVLWQLAGETGIESIKLLKKSHAIGSASPKAICCTHDNTHVLADLIVSLCHCDCAASMKQGQGLG